MAAYTLKKTKQWIGRLQRKNIQEQDINSPLISGFHVAKY